MKLTGLQLLKKLNVLLAVLLCCAFTLAVPVSAKAAPGFTQTKAEAADLSADNQLVLFAGEVTSGEPEAVLQLDRSMLAAVLQVVLQKLYPQENTAAPSPHSFPASKGDCGLHTILTKGP